jgi:hypothetical protein
LWQRVTFSVVVPVVVVVAVVVPVVLVLLVPVVVPVVPVVVPVVLVPVVVLVVPVVPVVACPQAGNANTKRKVRATKIVRKYSTGFPLLVLYHIYPSTIDYGCKQCKDSCKRDVAASAAAATGIQTFDNTSPTTHSGE